jgi:membrane protein DedA with SNARE-associated domain
VFDWLADQVSNSALTYLVLVLACGSDVMLPLIPSETMVMTAGVLAAQDELALWLVVPAVALGAFVGDNVMYALGRSVGDPVADRLFHGERGRARQAWAERAVCRRGTLIILVGRFIPGGRTVSTFAAGTLELPYARFLRADAAAAVLWACYASLLGYAGGEAFKQSLWKPLAATLGAAAALALALELWRRVQRRRGRDLLGDELPVAPGRPLSARASQPLPSRTDDGCP